MRSFRLPALALLAALTLTACGDDAPTATDPEPTATPTPSQTPEPEPPSRAGEDVVPADLDRDLLFAAEAWLRLARGERGPGLPVDTPVTVLLGGDEALTVDAADAGDPATWNDLCDAQGEGYAMRECPIRALPYFKAPGVELTTKPAQAPCDRPPGVDPADVGATKRVTLLAAGERSCLDYAAVELYVNDVAQLVAVDLVIGSP